MLSRADTQKTDPVLGDFLSFLAQAMPLHPERILPANQELLSRIERLVASADIDLDAPLDEADD